MQLAGMLAISLTAAVLQQLAQLTVSRHYVTSVWSTTICRWHRPVMTNQHWWRLMHKDPWPWPWPWPLTPDPDPDPDLLSPYSQRSACCYIHHFFIVNQPIFNSDTTLCICSCAVIFMVLLQHSSFAVAPTGSHIWTFLNCNLSLDSLSLLNRPRG